jgi:hypothetical protein
MFVADQIQDHQARCLAHLTILRMLARGEPGTPPARQVVAEIVRATSAILAEAEAAGRAALAAAGGRHNRGGETFLRVRLDRLAAAAQDVIASAQTGNSAEVRQHLYRFDTLTSAIWTVHDAVYALRQIKDQSPLPGLVSGSLLM